MENRTWQPVPGVPGASVYPYVRRPDVLSANSYLIESPNGRVLIDPGALPQQAGELLRVIADRGEDRVLPLLVALTHCHMDHSREAPAFLNDPARPAWLAAQAAGAQALAAADVRRTAAELYGMDMPSMRVRIPLLTDDDVRSLRPRRIRLADGFGVRVRTEAADAPEIRQWLDLDGLQIEVIPCAGHSPDSVCYRLGEFLFIGDLLLANKPMVAGVHGWDNRRLAQSVDQVIRLLEGGSIAWCCPGHGLPLPAEKTLGLLRRQRDQASRSDDVAALDCQRLFQAVDMAMELIDEGEEVFSALAGRLLYVADRLDMLEEEALARRCREAMDMDALDALLQGFRELCRSLAAGAIPQMAFAIEAAGIVEKLRKSFAPDPLAAFLPAPLINQAQRLLLDFMGIAQGVRNLEEFVPTEIGALLAEAETAWQSSPHLDESIADQADDPDRFAAELARRIGHPPPVRRMPVGFDSGTGGPLVHVAAVRFGDTLIQFLEWLALAGADSAAVAGGIDAAPPFVEIRLAGRMPDESLRTRAKLRSFERRFALSGFELAAGPESFRLVHGAHRSPPRGTDPGAVSGKPTPESRVLVSPEPLCYNAPIKKGGKHGADDQGG